eukprot:CAMPEP_0204610116 /NCGR_PEP_ID=MMETSP0661-20131031/61311_1 /ASSEMBLY_ACC=CAM_ASM_000606 /TAXON_ID=109239 /ORGANISM="Alexandrium margalefi, Strain AMGDE01CS-322" /LENGTH=86 /DNA_ID=CAMNT_0051621915 /DNA_START=24 /DNA_END=281 /DNA_ORIENTATION=+
MKAMKSAAMSKGAFADALATACEMAPKMKAMKSATMTKGAFADALATACEMKKKHAAKTIASIVEIATAEVKKNGIFTLPGLCRIK